MSNLKHELLDNFVFAGIVLLAILGIFLLFSSQLWLGKWIDKSPHQERIHEARTGKLESIRSTCD